jgi:hypothetical protein
MPSPDPAGDQSIYSRSAGCTNRARGRSLIVHGFDWRAGRPRSRLRGWKLTDEESLRAFCHDLTP